MTLLAVCGSGSTTTAYALAMSWPTPNVVLVEADPSGGDLAAWLDLPEQPGVASAVASAPTGSWPMIERHLVDHVALRLFLMPVRASEASVATRELAARLVRTLSALAGLTAIADCGRLHPSALSPVLTQSAMVVVSVRQPTSSPRAAAAHLDRVAELCDALTARALPTVAVLTNEVPYRATEIADFLGRKTDRLPVLTLADDPVGAAQVAGRERVGRSFTRTQLARSAGPVAAELAVRLDALRNVEVGMAER